jgi:nickel/cobalt exporter
MTMLPTSTETAHDSEAGLPVRSFMSGWRLIAVRLAIVACAVAIIGGVFSLVLQLVFPAPPEPARAPFGMSARETVPQGNALANSLLALQGLFYQHMQGAMRDLRETGTAFWTLMGVGFAYGVFHAAGPGHGKAVISAYLVADERALRRGIGLCFAAALLQAVVAIVMIAVAIFVLSMTAPGIDRLTGRIETASFAVVAALGLFLTWRKAGHFLDLVSARRGAGPVVGASCDHVHLPPPEQFMRLRRWREYAGVVFAAGLRPCAGALILLVFATSQGLIGAGIAAVFAMALGTAITTSIIALSAVFMKEIALLAAGGRARYAPLVGGVLELLAAAFVLVVGFALLAGYLSVGGF